MILLVGLLTGLLTANPSPPPKLVVLISVDMMRGDYVEWVTSQFPSTGFARLVEEGHWFSQALYSHAQTVTGAGHATLSTGATPRIHGIVGNSWRDVSQAKQVYCVEDPTSKSVGDDESRAGRSPANLRVPALADAVLARDGAKAFAVAIKDRTAVLLAGQRGKALWFSTHSGRFVSSDYYFPANQLPDWLVAFHDDQGLARFAGTSWDLLYDADRYRYGQHDRNAEERPPGGWDSSFPHRLPTKRNDLAKQIRRSPYGDIFTLDLAKALIEHEQLGEDDVPDFLGVGLSAMDYVGHAFGPSSLELEDHLARTDLALGQFLDYLEESVGPGQYLVGLSSDHGTDEIPEFRKRACATDDATLRHLNHPGHAYLDPGRELCDAGRHEPRDFIKKANHALRPLGTRAKLVLEYWHPNLYFDEKRATREGIDLDQAANAVAAALRQDPAFDAVVTAAQLETEPTDPLLQMIWEGFDPERSGHLVLATAPYWYLYQGAFGSAAMHGSHHAYDRHVPLLLLGPGVAPGQTDRLVHPRDLAPTLASILQLRLEHAVGIPLNEAIAR